MKNKARKYEHHVIEVGYNSMTIHRNIILQFTYTYASFVTQGQDMGNDQYMFMLILQYQCQSQSLLHFL